MTRCNVIYMYRVSTRNWFSNDIRMINVYILHVYTLIILHKQNKKTNATNVKKKLFLPPYYSSFQK